MKENKTQEEKIKDILGADLLAEIPEIKFSWTFTYQDEKLYPLPKSTSRKQQDLTSRAQ